ncbi:MAG: lipopolysaccharide heptosyltransferase I [Phycisphaerae bacterium]|nr:lipopolysaccharide heptosyltransferase I [Phycisphaerae bacterium]
MPARILDHNAVRRILIIKPSSLGDIVHALPVLAALRAARPDAHIAWLVNHGFAPLIEGHPLLDEVILFDRRSYGQMHRRVSVLGAFGRFVHELRERRFDLVVDLQGLFRSGFLALVSGARHRIGFQNAREFASLFYTHRVTPPRHIRHAVDRNLFLAKTLGLNVIRPAFPLGLRTDEIEAARVLLAEADGCAVSDFTAVIPGARWATKRWLPERIAEVMDRLHDETGRPTVLLGAPDERPVADQVLAGCSTPVVDLVGRTSLRELTALLQLAACVVCHDSGPMHIAAALDKPMVALFGPTDPARCGPYSRNARIVTSPASCAPCYKRVCSDCSCMRDLTTEQVLAAVRRLEPVILGPRPVPAPAP